MLGLGNNLTRGGVLSGFENNYSVDFNGSSHSFNTRSPFQTEIRTGQFTFACWIKPDDGRPSSNYTIMGVEDQTGDDSQIRFILAGHKFSGRLQALIEIEGSAVINAVSDSAILSDGSQSDFAFVAFVIDAAGGGDISLFKDGVKLGLEGGFDGDISGENTALWSSGGNIYVGSFNQNGTTEYGYTGFIDEVVIWDTNLSEANILKLYNEGVPTNLQASTAPGQSSLVSWWRFEEGSGTDVSDETGTNDATLSHDIFSTTVPG